MNTLALTKDDAKKIAESIFAYVHDEQIDRCEGELLELELGKNQWIDGRIDVDTREFYEKGDYYTPDYCEREVTGISLRYSANMHDDANDDDGLGIEINDGSIKDINRELARLCA